MRELLPDLENWLNAGERVALATVISTWGSAPRRAGSVMAISERGGIAGSVSGGCVEGAVVTFYIGGKKAAESGSWKNYELNTVNLTYTTPTVTATPKPPVVGNTATASSDAAATWLFVALGLGALAFGVGGATVARRSR